jgi:hypothetical protein
MVGLLLGAKPKKEESEDMGGDAKTTAAEAVLAAIKDNDVSALSEALKLHYDACSMGEYESEED